MCYVPTTICRLLCVCVFECGYKYIMVDDSMDKLLLPPLLLFFIAVAVFPSSKIIISNIYFSLIIFRSSFPI
jgi:hypothetical protein